jgi:carboxyl-terminal processing protease
MLTSRTTKYFLLASVITIFIICSFAAGVAGTWLLLHGRTATADEAAEFGVFWEAWHLVEGHFFGDLPNMQQVAWGAIRGALDTLDDPHTTFLEPQPRQREKEQLSGRFGGIGAYVSQTEDGSITLDPMPDLPAERAGVLEGDVILQVDDTEITVDMTVDEVVTLIRGQVGTIVRLTLRRTGQAESLVVEIERQEIPSPSVEWRLLEDPNTIGYVRLFLFSSRTAKELTEAIQDLKDLGATSLILDLRGNGGGLLDAAIDVSSRFLADGVVLYEVDNEGQEKAYRVTGGPTFEELPLVLLVDGGTASASEILAGALQDRARATLVGQKTYGKASVQQVFDLTDGSSVHITSNKWLTPDRRQIDGEGLMPDYEIAITDEDRDQGRDPQLDQAIQQLLQVQ